MSTAETKEIIEDDEGKYIGTVINGIKDGNGVIRYKNGNEYHECCHRNSYE